MKKIFASWKRQFKKELQEMIIKYAKRLSRKCLEFGRRKLPSRRISLAMLAGLGLKAISAAGEPLPIGPWDPRPQPTAGRLANYLDIQIHNFMDCR